MDRLAIPLVMPLAVTVVTFLIIVGIGTLLLELSHAFGEHIAVAAALAIAGAVLAGCALVARGGPADHPTHH
jgi:hypothetical protein